MNRIFKTIWSYTLNRPVVTDELHSAKHGKKSGKTATAAVLSATALFLTAVAPVSAAETEDGWTVINDPIINAGINADNQKLEYRSEGDIDIQAGINSDALYAANSSVKIVAGGKVSLSSDVGSAQQYAGGINARGGSDVDILAQSVNISTRSPFMSKGVSFEGNLQITSTGTSKDDLIAISASSEGGYLSVFEAMKGTATLDSATRISITGSVLRREDNGDTNVNNCRGFDLSKQGSVVLSAEDSISGDFSFSHNPATPTDINRERDAAMEVYGESGTLDGYSLRASADQIFLSVNSNHSASTVLLGDGGKIQLTADSLIKLTSKGSNGQKFVIQAQQGGNSAAVAEINADNIVLKSDLTTPNVVPENKLKGFQREASYVLRTQGDSKNLESAAPQIRIGTEGAEYIELNASINGVGSVGGLRGEQVGEISIGTADKSVIAIYVNAVNNSAAKDGYTPLPTKNNLGPSNEFH